MSVLVTGLAITCFASILAFRAYDADESQRFNEAVSELQNDLQFRLDFYVNSIRQLAAAYSLNPKMTQSQFLSFTEASGMRASDRGIYSFGVVRRSKGPHPRFTIELRAVGVHRPTEAIPLGTEIEDEARLSLFQSAISSGEPALKLHVAGIRDKHESGSMMAVAAYEGAPKPSTSNERERRAIAIAYARFSDNGLFDQSIGASGSYKSHLNIEIFRRAEPVFTRLDNATSKPVRREASFQIEGAGEQFKVRIRSTQSPLYSVAGLISFLIAGIGTALSLVLFRVIRERDRRSDRLFKSERQLKLMTESLPVLIAYIDRDYIYRFNNRIYEEMTGRQRDQITGRSLEEVLGTRRFKQLKPAVDLALSGESVERDWTLTLDDESQISYHQVLLPDRDHRGLVRGVVAMHTDITDRVKRQSRSVFLEEITSILATSLDPVVVTEKLAHKMLALADWCVIELVDDAGVVNRHKWAASTPEREKKLSDYYVEFPPNKSDRRITTRARKTKQTQFIKKVSRESVISSIPDLDRLERFLTVGFQSVVVVPLVSNERVLGTLALYGGQSEKHYDLDDVRFFEEIAQRAALAIDNARLYAASQNLNRAKDHFLAMLSHELRTPMNVILGWLEILTTEDVDQETYRQALETLNRNAKVQIQLINDLLDVSRIINGKLSLQATRSNLTEIATLAIDSVKPAVRAKSIETKLETHGDLVAAVDNERIQQVLWNLLSNAVKFTPQGGRITLTLTGDVHDVRIEVRDSGSGIDESFLPFVFDRFRQEESGFTRTQGGLGLGLSIVRYIVEGHGGTISVASEGRDKGATFTVVLPKLAQINEDIQLTPPVP